MRNVTMMMVLALCSCDDTTTTTDTDTDTDTTDTDTDTATCATDICATYGAAVPTVASDITDAAAADPLFMDDFAALVAEGAEAVAAFKTSLANFIAVAYGCADPSTYTGPTMEAAHAGQGITQADYDAFVALIAGELAANGVTQPDIDFCFAPVLTDPAFSSTIVGQ